MSASRLVRQNGWVRLDGEGICLDCYPKSDKTARQMLKEHVADQRAYIARLTARADRVDAFLGEKS